MSFEHLLLVCLFLVLLPANVRAIPNGDFENEYDGALADWNPGQVLPARVPNSKAGCEDLKMRIVWDTQSHGNGKGSLRIDCKGVQAGQKSGDNASCLVCSPAQAISVRPDTQYNLRWFWKATGVTTASTVDVVVFVQSPGPIGGGQGSRFLKQFVQPLAGDSADWQPASLSFKTPPDAGWLQVRISGRSSEAHHRFSVWLDDFDLSSEAKDMPEHPATDKPSHPRSPLKDIGLREQLGFELLPSGTPRGARIQRTMKLLASSSPEHRNRVKILFYGQSIIAQNWWRNIVADLHERYPHADIVAENRSIGGFMSDVLQDTMHADCYPANADLICFHDYARDDATMGQILTNMRALTTAEVVVFTHHIAAQKSWEAQQNKDSELLVRLADKLGFELIDIRSNWRSFLGSSKLKESALLKDVVHLNPLGEALWWKIAMPHFKYIPDAPAYWRPWVKVYSGDGRVFVADASHEYPYPATLLTRPLKLSFEGNRVDLLAGARPGQHLGSARIIIDGKSPSSFANLYVVTRGSRPANFFQPMLRRAKVGENPVVETWTLTFSQMTENGEDFKYQARGSVTGEDGTGNARERFVSTSGRLIIEPQWFHIQSLVKSASKGKPYTDGTTCVLDVLPNFLDVWKPSAPGNSDAAPDLTGASGPYGPSLFTTNTSASEQRYTLASGLSNGSHTLEIIPNDDGDLPLRAIVVHRPPQ